MTFKANPDFLRDVEFGPKPAGKGVLLADTKQAVEARLRLT